MRGPRLATGPALVRVALGDDPPLIDAAFKLGFKMRRLMKVGWDKEPDKVRRAVSLRFEVPCC
jgi:hypothetical protein